LIFYTDVISVDIDNTLLYVSTWNTSFIHFKSEL